MNFLYKDLFTHHHKLDKQNINGMIRFLEVNVQKWRLVRLIELLHPLVIYLSMNDDSVKTIYTEVDSWQKVNDEIGCLIVFIYSRPMSIFAV